MKISEVWVAAAVVVMMSGALAAAPDGKSFEGIVRQGLLHRPQDVAPSEQVIVPRPPEEARPKGSLLATAQHPPRRIDTEELLRRKHGFYEGHVICRSLPGAVGPVSPVAGGRPTDLAVGQGAELGTVVYWLLLAATALGALWLLIKVFLNKLHTRTC